MKRITKVVLCLICTTTLLAQKPVKEIANAHTAAILTFSLSSDATQIITGGADKRSNLFEIKTGKKLKSFGGHSDQISSVAFNANNKLFVSGSLDKSLIVWDNETGKPKKILRDHTDGITAIDFNPINDQLASASLDNTLKIWDVDAGTMLYSLEGHNDKVNAVAYSPDGKQLASGSSDKTIKIWDAENGDLIHTIETELKEVLCIKYSFDKKFIAAGGSNGNVELFNPNTGSKLNTLEGFKKKVNTVAFSSDVQFLAAAGDDKKVFVWDLELWQQVKDFAKHDEEINHIAFGPKGKRLYSVSNGTTILGWNVTDLKIGEKKFIQTEEHPKLVCSSLSIKDGNNNGIIESSEKCKLKFSIKNEGAGVAYDVVAKIEVTTPIEGLSIDRELLLGNLNSNKSQKVEIPIYATTQLEEASSSFKVTILEANHHNSESQTIAFQTKGGATYNYIMVVANKFSSATGKAEIGAPITLKLTLKNSSKGDAKNIKVNYLFPEHVLAVDKLSESIAHLPAGETKEVEVQFYANKEFSKDKLKVNLIIDGAAFTNTADLDLVITMNEELPADELYGQLMAQNASDIETLYRGGGDPLKGLNVSKSREVLVGDYYALIIGIDGYSGTWSPLKNAVNDAKAIEQMLRTTYKFDHFRVLYDSKATRSKIIAEMEWLVENVKKRDNLFVYYSGHGEYKESLNKGYWVPVDATTNSTSNYISNSDIQTFLGGIKSKHTLLVSDACFSGDIFRGHTVSVPFEESEKYYREVSNLTSRQALTSGGIEPVMDGGRDGHSVFAYYLLKVLNGNQNKYIDANQLYEKIKIPVINNSDQTPKIAPIKNSGDEGGQFIFIKK
ncbi:caspase family protein [bacterium AH-315-C07]|nr:caspase family protein [bacterium AH-315-C07]